MWARVLEFGGFEDVVEGLERVFIGCLGQGRFFPVHHKFGQIYYLVAAQRTAELSSPSGHDFGPLAVSFAGTAGGDGEFDVVFERADPTDVL